MKLFKTISLFLGILLSLAQVVNAIERQNTAENSFQEGKFDEAEQHFLKLAKTEPKNYENFLRLGNIALLNNKLEQAKEFLTPALELKPDDETTLKLLSQVYYRQDKFDKAAPFFRKMGDAVIAKKLESFNGLVPYQTDKNWSASEIRFIHTDPLPLIHVKVNDQEANFIIDTGASEIYLDTEFAKQAGAQDFGSTVETYGGGKQAVTGHGKIDKLIFGDLTIKNIPVHILSTQKFSAAANGLKVDGIIGTVLFYHFLSTIDYPNGKLLLLRKTSEPPKTLEGRKPIVVPFWMSGDHLMVGWGVVNKSKPMLLLIDTGLAGGGFVPTETSLKESGIRLPEGQSVEGIGGGGKVSIVPITVEKLALGDAEETNIDGFFGPFPSKLEFSEGFRIGGIISHQFFRSYAVTFDFTEMKLFLNKSK